MILMQENKKTNKKTIIFQSPEVKALCDALIQAQSKKTGIAIMRLIENALIKEFGFKDDKLTEWCREYCNDSATTSYMSLLRLLPDNSDLFNLYKVICQHTNIPMTNDIIMKNPKVQQASIYSDSHISEDKTVERIFMLCNRKDLDKIIYDFIYSNSNLLDTNPVPLENIVSILLTVDGRDAK